jgi:hypothetical protein
MAKAYYQIAKIRMLRKDEENAITFLGYAFDIDSTYRSYAEEEPIFSRLKDYINEIGLDTDASKRLAKMEAVSHSNEEKADEYLKEDLSKEFTSMENTKEDTAKKAIDDHLYNMEDINTGTIATNNDVLDPNLEHVEEEKVIKNESEELTQKYDINDDVEEFDESLYIEEEPKKTGLFGFIKKIFGKDKDYPEDETEELDEDEEEEDPLYPTKKTNEEEIEEKEDLFDKQENNYNVRIVSEPTNKDAKKAFEKEFTDSDLDIFEKFKKLKEEEEEKAKRFKNIENTKNEDDSYYSKSSEIRKTTSSYSDKKERPRKRSFDFDTAEINEDLAIDLNELDEQSYSKQITHFTEEDEQPAEKITKEETELADDLDTGFDYLKRYKR